MKPLERLHQEQQRLKDEIQKKETRISERFKHLEENFGSMALYSVLPISSGQKEKMSGIFDKLNKAVSSVIPIKISEEKKEKYGNIIKVAEMVASGLAYKYLTRMWK